MVSQSRQSVRIPSELEVKVRIDASTQDCTNANVLAMELQCSSSHRYIIGCDSDLLQMYAKRQVLDYNNTVVS